MLNGMWMWTAGLTACCIDLMTHTVGAALALQSIFVATLLVLGQASIPKLPATQNYSGLDTSDEDETQKLTSGSAEPWE